MSQATLTDASVPLPPIAWPAATYQIVDKHQLHSFAGMSELGVPTTESAADDSQQKDLRERAMDLYIRFIPDAMQTAGFPSHIIRKCSKAFASKSAMEDESYAQWKSGGMRQSQRQCLEDIEGKIKQLELDYFSNQGEHQRLREVMCILLHKTMNALVVRDGGLYPIGTSRAEGEYQQSYHTAASEFEDRSELFASAWEKALGWLTDRYFTSVEEMMTLIEKDADPTVEELSSYSRATSEQK
jgi:hypothetical protein